MTLVFRAELFGPLRRQSSLMRLGMFVNDVLQLHDSLRPFAQGHVRVPLLEQSSGHLVRFRVSGDDAVKLRDRVLRPALVAVASDGDGHGESTPADEDSRDN